MSLIRMLYYIIRTAKSNNGKFPLLTANKNFQRHTCSLSQSERNQ